MSEVDSARDAALEERRARLQAALDDLKPAALFRIWTHPARTVRALLQLRPERRLHQLSMTSGIGLVFVVCTVGGLGRDVRFSDLLTLIILMGGLCGMTALYAGAEIASRIGRKLGGHGDAIAMRCALGWGAAPWAESSLVLAGLTFAALGRGTFAQPPGSVPAVVVSIAAGLLLAWSIRTWRITIAEAHGITRGAAGLTLLATAGILILAGAGLLAVLF
ncbi:MAG: Yip1 family protein [Planctomycetota bacterium]